MKPLIYGSALVMFTLLSLPTTSDAFSRRSHSSDFGPMQTTTAPLNNTSNTSAQSVPEPPVLMLMSIGLGVFGSSYVLRRFRKQS